LAVLGRELEAIKKQESSQQLLNSSASLMKISKKEKDSQGKAGQGSQKDPKAIPQSSPFLQLVSTEDITPELIKGLKPKVLSCQLQIEDYLKEKIDYLDCQNLFEAHVCLEIVKQLYNSKMKEYIKELGIISNKLRYYDEYIAKKYG
jgi:hypothetical protein